MPPWRGEASEGESQTALMGDGQGDQTCDEENTNFM